MKKKLPAKPRDTLLREETYRKGALMVRDGSLPTLYHVSRFKVISCEIQKSGVVERNGQRLEYQVLKVFLEERPANTKSSDVSVHDTSGGQGLEYDRYLDSQHE